MAACQAYMLFYLRSDCVDEVGCGLQEATAAGDVIASDGAMMMDVV